MSQCKIEADLAYYKECHANQRKTIQELRERVKEMERKLGEKDVNENNITERLRERVKELEDVNRMDAETLLQLYDRVKELERVRCSRCDEVESRNIAFRKRVKELEEMHRLAVERLDSYEAIIKRDIARVKELKILAQSLSQDKERYMQLWGEACAEIDKLRKAALRARRFRLFGIRNG